MDTVVEVIYPFVGCFASPIIGGKGGIGPVPRICEILVIFKAYCFRDNSGHIAAKAACQAGDIYSLHGYYVNGVRQKK